MQFVRAKKLPKPRRGPLGRASLRSREQPRGARLCNSRRKYQKERTGKKPVREGEGRGGNLPKPRRGPLGRASLRSREQPRGARLCNSRRKYQKERTGKNLSFLFGSPMGNRTPVSAVRGRRLNRLTMRPFQKLDYYTILSFVLQEFFLAFSKNATEILRNTKGERGRSPEKDKKRSACAAGRKSVNPLLAGGCAAVPRQTFRS